MTESWRRRALRHALSVLLMGSLACHAVADGEGERVTVVFVDRTISRSDEPITEFELRMACPPETPAQTIHALEMQPRPSKVETDQWGQKIARWRVPELEPGQQLVVRWIADATLYPWQVDLESVRVGSPDDIPQEVRDLYLRAGGKYALESEVVRSAAAEVSGAQAQGQQPNTLELIGALFDYVVDHLKYARDSTWDSADVVLDRGTGSCSEYAFAFIALCRANGIPARYVGGNARRSDAAFYIDRISHRWAEAYLPGVGWTPFDPTRSDGKGKYRRFFGRTPEHVLALVRGDGGPDSALSWRYESYHTWQGPKDAVGIHRRAWWFPPVAEEVRSRVADVAVRTGQARGPKAKRGLIRRARAIGHPYVLPWLEDFLYDRKVRVAAAQAVRDIGGPPAVVALIDCLERANDPEGDAAVGRMLDEWTGETHGASRSAWRDWLRTAAFRKFTEPGEAGSER